LTSLHLISADDGIAEYGFSVRAGAELPEEALAQRQTSSPATWTGDRRASDGPALPVYYHSLITGSRQAGAQTFGRRRG
jgi:hypothetical protein